MIAEAWLPITGYEGLYDVSNRGRVRSLDHILMSRNQWGPYERHERGRILKPQVGTHGYRQVGLSRNGQVVIRRVHELVLEAFVGSRPHPDSEGRHGPAGKLDNSVPNLCWGTAADNQGDRERDGTSNHGRDQSAKLTPAIVLECRRRHADGAGESQSALSREFGVSQSAMHCAIAGKTYAYVRLDPLGDRARLSTVPLQDVSRPGRHPAC